MKYFGVFETDVQQGHDHGELVPARPNRINPALVRRSAVGPDPIEVLPLREERQELLARMLFHTCFVLGYCALVQSRSHPRQKLRTLGGHPDGMVSVATRLPNKIRYRPKDYEGRLR